MKFNWLVRVYWEDTDAGGIVFYANYLKFFERARTEWLRSLGIEQQKLRETQNGLFVVSACELKFLRSARLDDMLVIATQIERVGPASIELRQNAYLCDALVQSPDIFEPSAQSHVDAALQPSDLLCESHIRIAWAGVNTSAASAPLRAQRMPKQIYTVLSQYLA